MKSSAKPKSIVELMSKSGLVSGSRLAKWLKPIGWVARNAPPDSIEEVYDDCVRVISAVASRYVDPSCPNLHFDELCSQGMLKLVELDNSGYFWRAASRVEWFKIFKTCISNHVMAQVHRYRLTAKRTGHVRLKRRERITQQVLQAAVAGGSTTVDDDDDAAQHTPFEDDSRTRPNEISLDDPEARLQVGEPFDSGTLDARELYEDIAVRLTPFDRMVLAQMHNPNGPARVLAEVDASRAKRQGAFRVEIKTNHLASGLGVDTEQFEQAKLRIRTATREVMSDHDHDHDHQNLGYTAAIIALCDVFSVDVPDTMRSPSAPEVFRLATRRLFTLAARAHPELVTPDVASLMNVVGARVPEQLQQDTLSCYGVLYEEHNAFCGACSLCAPCAHEASQVGLDGKLVVSQKLLGAAGSRRIPILLPRNATAAKVEAEPTAANVDVVADPDSSTEVGIYAVSERDEEIFRYLNSHFRRARHGLLAYFKARETKGNKYLFMLRPLKDPSEPSEDSTSIKLRFTKPGPEVARELSSAGHRGFALKPEMSAADAIRLIDMHAGQRFTDV